MVVCFLCYYLDLVVYFLFFLFFKQRTAYEMRISDWSSDVCSSDLISALTIEAFGFGGPGLAKAESLDGESGDVRRAAAVVVEIGNERSRRQDRKSVV